MMTSTTKPSIGQLPSMNSTTFRKQEVIIRPYRNADSDKVRELYVRAMTVGDASPGVRALREQLTLPLSYALYSIFLLGLLLSASSFTSLQEALPNGSMFFSRPTRTVGLLISALATTLFLGWRWSMWRTLTSYMKRNLENDLADIGTHYRMGIIEKGEANAPSGPNGFWIAEVVESGEIVGCIGLDTTKSSSPHIAELRRMAVSPAHHRRGIASQLLHTLISHARTHQVAEIHLSTSMYQVPAMQMYEKFGWVEEKRVQANFSVGSKIIAYFYRLKL